MARSPTGGSLTKQHATCYPRHPPAWACYERQASGETPNLAASLGEPQGTVRPGRDEGGSALGCWQRELADRARRRDAPDLAAPPFGVRNAHHFGKPEGVVRSGRDAGRLAARWQRELTDRARRCDAPDLAALEFGKPEVAIRSGRDA